jgi:hypothetical protein
MHVTPALRHRRYPAITHKARKCRPNTIRPERCGRGEEAHPLVPTTVNPQDASSSRRRPRTSSKDCGPAGPRPATKSLTVWSSYKGWCAERGIVPGSHAKFGKLARWQKERIGGSVWYLDCELAEGNAVWVPPKSLPRPDVAAPNLEVMALKPGSWIRVAPAPSCALGFVPVWPLGCVPCRRSPRKSFA